MSEIWNKQKSKGDFGEYLVKQYLLRKGHKVQDLSNNPDYWEVDIDFLVDEQFYCEVKSDYVTGRTGNLFLEYQILYKNGKKADGYFNKSKAEYLFYLDMKNKILHCYNFAELREYVEKTKPITRTCNDGYKVVYGYCVPVNAVPHQKDTVQEAG